MSADARDSLSAPGRDRGARWLVIESVKLGKPSMIGIVTGAVAGLATITPASGFVGPTGALIIGLAGGKIC